MTLPCDPKTPPQRGIVWPRPSMGSGGRWWRKVRWGWAEGPHLLGRHASGQEAVGVLSQANLDVGAIDERVCVARSGVRDEGWTGGPAEARTLARFYAPGRLAPVQVQAQLADLADAVQRFPASQVVLDDKRHGGHAVISRRCRGSL